MSDGPWCVRWQSWDIKDLSRHFKGGLNHGKPIIFPRREDAEKRASGYASARVVTVTEAMMEFGDWRGE